MENYIKKKRVCFDEEVVFYETYSTQEYDRYMIDSILYQRSFNRISDNEWCDILNELLNYKRNEMIVHINTYINILVMHYQSKYVNATYSSYNIYYSIYTILLFYIYYFTILYLYYTTIIFIHLYTIYLLIYI